LATKIKALPASALPPHENPFLDWTANLFMVSRWQCIILTNSKCLYSVVMPRKGITSEKAFLDQGLSVLRDYVAFNGTVSLFSEGRPIAIAIGDNQDVPLTESCFGEE
jgi:hypothetical protein